MKKKYFPTTKEKLKELVRDESVHSGEIDISVPEDLSGVLDDLTLLRSKKL
ncbi:hypothetical protein [Helicobacter salomonis]|uniref:hypothetical protein n=1 Tax=Helicobacter salomonis TaxID=56878 RepID=UPI0013156DAC|nr:hypothetical protein [Helicobacter salomonis]